MNVLITGATGMVGKGVMLECLDHPEVERVYTLGRRKTGIEHNKLEEIIHSDFTDYSNLRDTLAVVDACYFCLGISSAGMKEADYKRITYDYTLALARELYEANPAATFTYVSGQGTDSSENGRIMWARVKGKTENDVIGLGFKQAFAFRPGIIIPKRGIRSATRLYQFFYDYFMWLIRFFKLLFPKSIVNTTQLGKAMINVTKKGYAKNVIDPKDILILAEDLSDR